MSYLSKTIASLVATTYAVYAHSASAFAAGSVSEEEPPLLKESSIYVDLLKMIAALAVIVGIIFILIRLLSKRGKWFQGQKVINRLAGLQLAQHKSLQVIEVGDMLYVVGVGDDVQLIDKIDDPEQVAAIKQRLYDDSDSTGRSFQELFYEKMSRSKDMKNRQLKNWSNENGTEDRTDNQ